MFATRRTGKEYWRNNESIEVRWARKRLTQSAIGFSTLIHIFKKKWVLFPAIPFKMKPDTMITGRPGNTCACVHVHVPPNVSPNPGISEKNSQLEDDANHSYPTFIETKDRKKILLRVTKNRPFRVEFGYDCRFDDAGVWEHAERVTVSAKFRCRAFSETDQTESGALSGKQLFPPDTRCSGSMCIRIPSESDITA